MSNIVDLNDEDDIVCVEVVSPSKALPRSSTIKSTNSSDTEEDIEVIYDRHAYFIRSRLEIYGIKPPPTPDEDVVQIEDDDDDQAPSSSNYTPENRIQRNEIEIHRNETGIQRNEKEPQRNEKETQRNVVELESDDDGSDIMLRLPDNEETLHRQQLSADNKSKSNVIQIDCDDDLMETSDNSDVHYIDVEDNSSEAKRDDSTGVANSIAGTSSVNLVMECNDSDADVHCIDLEDDTQDPTNEDLGSVIAIPRRKNRNVTSDVIEEIIHVDDEDDTSTRPASVASLPSKRNLKTTAYRTVAVIDVDEDDKLHNRPEDPFALSSSLSKEEIIRRIMPTAVPGLASLYTPPAHLLPKNVKPHNYCYYYHISSHIIPEELSKSQFLRLKNEMLLQKNVFQPCSCLSHPLNRASNARATSLNPYSIYHRPACYFSEKMRTEGRQRNRPRRLSYQISVNRIPQKRDSKHLKDWKDVVANKKKAGEVHASDPPWVKREKENLLKHLPFKMKNESGADVCSNLVQDELEESSSAVKAENRV